MPKFFWAFTGFAIPLWTLVGASFWVRVNWRLLLIAAVLGGVFLVLAGVAWLLGDKRDRDRDRDMRDRDRDMDHLVAVVADLSLRRRYEAPTRPLKMVG